MIQMIWILFTFVYSFCPCCNLRCALTQTNLAWVVVCCNLSLEPFKYEVSARFMIFIFNSLTDFWQELKEFWWWFFFFWFLYDCTLSKKQNNEVRKERLVNLCNYYKAGKYWHVQMLNLCCTDVLSIADIFKVSLLSVYLKNLTFHRCLNSYFSPSESHLWVSRIGLSHL